MNIIRHWLEDMLRNLSGPVGNRLRYRYYKGRMKSMGKNVVIDTGVFFLNPSCISIGDGCWIDKGVTMIAGKAGTASDGELSIGAYSHIGVGTILQSHGGISIGDYFTSSSHCRIYSYSNDVNASTKGTMDIPSQQYTASFISKPVIMGKNVWLGLSVSVISATIGDDVFVMPHSVVSRDIPANIVAAGQPAAFIRKRFEGA